MKFSIAAILAAVGVAQAWENVTYTTEVVTAVTTFCPEATQITWGEFTYTVTEPTTLTISDCPCTVTKPITVVSSVYCETCSAAPTAPAAVWPSAGPASWPSNTTTWAAPPTTTTTVPLATAGADKAFAMGGAGLAAVFGIAAFVL